MPGLHLIRAPYDLFVWDFPYVQSYVALGYGACVNIVYEHHVICSTGFLRRSGYVRRPHGDRTEIVLSPQPPPEPVPLTYGGRAELVRCACDRRVVLASVYQTGSTSHVIYVECYGAIAYNKCLKFTSEFIGIYTF